MKVGTRPAAQKHTRGCIDGCSVDLKYAAVTAESDGCMACRWLCVVHAGGRCLAAARAAKLLEQLGPEAELLTVDVAHDTSE